MSTLIFDGLAGLHLGQLGFLEVGGHPDFAQRNDGHQVLPGADVLSDLHGALADDSVDRSDDGGVAEIELRLVECGFGALRLRLGGGGAGAGGFDLLGRDLRIAQSGIGLSDARLGDADLLLVPPAARPRER